MCADLIGPPEVGWAEKPGMMLGENAELFSPAYFRLRCSTASGWKVVRKTMLTHVFDTDKFIDLDRFFHELVPDADATDD